MQWADGIEKILLESACSDKRTRAAYQTTSAVLGCWRRDRDQSLIGICNKVLRGRCPSEGDHILLVGVVAEQGSLGIRRSLIEVLYYRRIVRWLRADGGIGGGGILCIPDEESVQVVGDWIVSMYLQSRRCNNVLEGLAALQIPLSIASGSSSWAVVFIMVTKVLSRWYLLSE